MFFQVPFKLHKHNPMLLSERFHSTSEVMYVSESTDGS